MTDHDLWQHLEAEFARVLGEVPKPKGPEPEKAKEAQSADAATRGRGFPTAAGEVPRYKVGGALRYG